jgi:NAD(P)H-dependent FMN reductase
MTAPDPHQLPPAGERIAVIIASTRPTRICPGIARWVRNVLQQRSPLRYEMIDLAEINLPFLDEPVMAAQAQYEHPHTLAWSRLIDSYRGFVFVFPQYNWGYPAPLKNALDFLYREWHGKPVTSVTYGTRGGNKAAQQIHQVFTGLHMRPLEDRLELVIADSDLDQNRQLRDLNAILRPYLERVRRLDVQMTEALRDTEEPVAS